MLIGAHVGSSDPLGQAAERGAAVIQMFISNPQSYKKPLPREDAEELRQSGVPIYIHAPYIMNPVSPNNRIRIPSRKTLAQTVEAAEAIGAKSVPVLIENTAGGGHAVVRELDNYAPLWEEIGEYNVGVCLDTCHAWAAGDDLATAVERIRAATAKLDLVHCNDSRDPHNSRRDRHTNLGKGMIPEELLIGVVKAADAPVVVETPSDEDGQKHDIAWLHEQV